MDSIREWNLIKNEMFFNFSTHTRMHTYIQHAALVPRSNDRNIVIASWITYSARQKLNKRCMKRDFFRKFPNSEYPLKMQFICKKCTEINFLITCSMSINLVLYTLRCRSGHSSRFRQQPSAHRAKQILSPVTPSSSVCTIRNPAIYKKVAHFCEEQKYACQVGDGAGRWTHQQWAES